VPIVRTSKTKNFTVISNVVFEDERLSLKAKGVYCVIASFGDDWDITLKRLEQRTGEGKDSLRKAIKELEEAGYMESRRWNDSKGHLKTEWTFFESPNAGFPKTVKPKTVKPKTAEPIAVNPHPLKELCIIKNSNNKELNKERTQESDVLFEEFWKSYPRKDDKQPAMKSYQRVIKGKLATHEELVDSAKAYTLIAKLNKTETKYIKLGSTWLNNACWENTYTSTTSTTPSTSTYDALLAKIKSVMDQDGNFEHGNELCNIHNIEKFMSVDDNGVRVYYTDARGYTNPKYFTIEAITKIGAYC
jgi:hypothetical protein